jgi:hypothetical protein
MPRRMHGNYDAVQRSANHEDSTGIAAGVNEDVK